MPHHQAPLQKNNMRRVHLALQRLSVDTEQLYQELGIDPKVMADEQGALNMLKHTELLERAAQQINNPFLGMAMALDRKNSELGILSYMLRNALNIEKALALIHKYVKLVDPGSSTELLRDGDLCIWTYKIQDMPPAHCTQGVEWAIFSFIHMIRMALGDDAWQPERIYLEHGDPATGQKLGAHFVNERRMYNMVYHHYFNGVCFPQALLQQPNLINDADPHLLALLELQAQQNVEQLLSSASLPERISLVISSKLGIQQITAGSVAADLGMSRSTMHRRLREKKVSFHAIREGIVIQVAKQSLANSTMSMADLAQKLGYSDSSAFNKAFKRLVGQRPLDYRKQHKDL